MSVHQIPSHGANDPKFDEQSYRILAGALPERANVPLVVYIDGKRKVIGEATVDGEQVIASVGSDAGDEILALIFGEGYEPSFSLGFRPANDERYQQPLFNLLDKTHHPLPMQHHIDQIQKFKENLADKIKAELNKMNDTAKEE